MKFTRPAAFLVAACSIQTTALFAQENRFESLSSPPIQTPNSVVSEEGHFPTPFGPGKATLGTSPDTGARPHIPNPYLSPADAAKQAFPSQFYLRDDVQYFPAFENQTVPQGRNSFPGNVHFLPPAPETMSPRDRVAAKNPQTLKILQLRSAAQNLALAGLQEESEKIRKLADQLQREYEQAQQPTSNEVLLQEIRQLRSEMDTLRHELRALRLQLNLKERLGEKVEPAEDADKNRLSTPSTPSSKIPDEDLDTPRSSLPPYPLPTPPGEQLNQSASNDVEFELVPIPVEEADDVSPVPDPEPTPAPTK
ncbi:hypothetical protein SH668x_002069 [Planctomicrobium sp. SH668]|uniref:hypothetical protein n=1 Tax=Planctomicrobium sp. SH668 TaxID=3448126 RepID=UPI003F5C5AD9